MRSIVYSIISLLSMVLLTIFTSLASISFICWIWQQYIWLMNGELRIYTLANILFKDESLPNFKWKAIEDLLHWVMEYPLGWKFALLMGLAAIIAGALHVTFTILAENAKNHHGNKL